ncbi:MAG: hypothetical protein ACKPE6_16155, partial [Gammaproteobacteria bacterium]
VNELREARGESPLPPPEVGALVDPAELAEGCGDEAPDAGEDLQTRLAALAREWRTATPALLAREGMQSALQGLGAAASSLSAACPPGGRVRMLQATSALCDAVLLGGADVDQRFDACLRGIAEDLDACERAGARVLAVRPSEALYRQLLAIVADSRPASGVLIDLQRRHRLVPGRRSPGQAAGEPMAGTESAAAISSQLATVMQRLEASEGDAEGIARTLREVEPDLLAIGGLLAGPGYREEHEMLQPQLERIAAGMIDGEGAEDRLTEITMALLEVDQRLAARIAEGGAGGESVEQRRHPLARARAALYREVQVLIEQAKQAVANHAGDSDGAGTLGEIPAPLHAAAGALQLAGLSAAAGLLTACRSYATRVSAGDLPAPGSAQIDALAEALSAVEYFLERLQLDGQPADLILERASGAAAVLQGESAPPAFTREELPDALPVP